MTDRTLKIVHEFKRNVLEKQDIVEIKLFGSAARGDSSIDSDIDIMVLVPELNRRIEEELFDIAYNLELKYDCLIDIIVLPQNVNPITPIYQNIKREGITV